MKEWMCMFYFFLTIVFCKNASEWRSRSVYQILTDRFSPTDLSSARCLDRPMSENASRNYCGGTYRGIVNQLDYIIEMGFNAIWISPIPSNIDRETIYGVGWHGYWQDHIYQLNQNFGSENDLINFINQAHQNDIWIMLDVVANHLGPNLTADYYPFNQPEHFHQPLCFIRDYQNQTQVEFCSIGDDKNPLPDLNTENDFVISTLNKWINEIVIKYQFDAIRIDTFRHVRKSFWPGYTSSAGVYSIGEVATSDTSYVGAYQQVADAIFHYPLYFVLKSIFTDNQQLRQSMFLLEKQVQENELHFKDTTLCGTFLDNHDQDRFLNHTQNYLRIQNALVYLFFSDGIPFIYLGTEQNFTGNPNEINGAGDPWNREPLWRSNFNRSTWIYQYLKKLNQIRSFIKLTFNEQFFLSHQKTIFIDNQTYVYQKGQLIIVISNEEFSQTKFIPNIPFSKYQDLITNQTKNLNKKKQLQINNCLPLILFPISSTSTYSSTPTSTYSSSSSSSFSSFTIIFSHCIFIKMIFTKSYHIFNLFSY